MMTEPPGDLRDMLRAIEERQKQLRQRRRRPSQGTQPPPKPQQPAHAYEVTNDGDATPLENDWIVIGKELVAWLKNHQSLAGIGAALVVLVLALSCLGGAARAITSWHPPPGTAPTMTPHQPQATSEPYTPPTHATATSQAAASATATMEGAGGGGPPATPTATPTPSNEDPGAIRPTPTPTIGSEHR